MAAGLGTRMRSAPPKHLHPLLGRRMVDWVLAAARPLGPTRSSSSRRPTRRSASTASTSPSQERAARDRRRRRAARGRRSAPRGDVLVLSGDTPLLTAELLQALVDDHRGAGADATVLSFVLDEPAATAASSAMPPASSPRSSRRADATPEELEIREVEQLDLRLPRRRALAGARPARAAQRAGRAVPHRRGRAASSATAARRGARRAPTRSRPGVNTRVELAAARPRSAIGSTGAHARRRDDRRSRVDVDRADVELEPDVTIHPFTVLRGATSVAAGVEIGPHVVAIDATIGPERSWARSVTFAPAPCSRRRRRRARSSR